MAGHQVLTLVVQVRVLTGQLKWQGSSEAERSAHIRKVGISKFLLATIYGVCSSIGRALDCESRGSGIETHQSPQNTFIAQWTRAFRYERKGCGFDPR